MESAEILLSEREKPRIVGRCHFLQECTLIRCKPFIQHLEVSFQMLQVGLACLADLCVPTTPLW